MKFFTNKLWESVLGLRLVFAQMEDDSVEPSLCLELSGAPFHLNIGEGEGASTVWTGG